MNIYDIARESGVSISTVSRVLNKHPNVTVKTKERVLAVLEKHDYVPSSIAKSLVNKATRSIGIMAMDVRHLHYASIAFTIEQKLSTYGYHAILCNTGYDKKKMFEYVRMLAEKQVDGVIMVGSVFSCDEIGESIDRYLPRTPIVMHNTSLLRKNIYNISTEEAHGIVLAVDYLAGERGIREIAFVRDYDTIVGHEKHETYRRKLEEYAIPYQPERAVVTTSGLAGGIAAVEELAGRGAEYRAIVGCDDITCLGVMRELRRRGVRIPEDVAVIGYNNTAFSEISDPTMTVIDNKEEMTGIMLARTIADVLRGRDVPAKTIVYPELIRRGTA